MNDIVPMETIIDGIDPRANLFALSAALQRCDYGRIVHNEKEVVAVADAMSDAACTPAYVDILAYFEMFYNALEADATDRFRWTMEFYLSTFPEQNVMADERPIVIFDFCRVMPDGSVNKNQLARIECTVRLHEGVYQLWRTQHEIIYQRVAFQVGALPDETVFALTSKEDYRFGQKSVNADVRGRI